MQILLVLIPVSLLLLVAAVGAFFWAVRRGQFENLDRAALDILVDDPAPRPSVEATSADAGGSAEASHAD
jgi:cbb3-type cytochrome oxidase maturation protein